MQKMDQSVAHNIILAPSGPGKLCLKKGEGTGVFAPFP